MKLRNPGLAGCFPTFFRNKKTFFSRHTNSQWIKIHPAKSHTMKNDKLKESLPQTEHTTRKQRNKKKDGQNHSIPPFGNLGRPINSNYLDEQKTHRIQNRLYRIITEACTTQTFIQEFGIHRILKFQGFRDFKKLGVHLRKGSIKDI